MKSKKAQYYPRPTYTHVHPLLVAGIALFVTPYITPVFGIELYAFLITTFKFMGLAGIVIGAALTIINATG